MTRVFQSGGEVEAASGTSSATSGPDGYKGGTGSLSQDFTYFRSGNASLKYDATATNLAVYTTTPTVTSTTSLYIRFYCWIPANFGVAAIIFTPDGTSTNMGVRARTDGALELVVSGSAQGSPSNVIATGNSIPVWYKVELFCNYSSTNWTQAELRVNDATVATWSGTQAASTGSCKYGLVTAPGNNFTIFMDDIAINNTSGTANNTWCGDGRVILRTPRSDGQKGSWTGGSDNTGALFGAVSQVPPTGQAAENNCTQIESTDSSGDNATDEYRGNCGPYIEEIWANIFSRTTNTQYVTFGQTAGSDEAYAAKFIAPRDCTTEQLSAYVLKVGAPTDNVQIAIYSNSSGVPGTALSSAVTLVAGGTVSATNIGLFQANYVCDLVGGTTYWVVFTRSTSANLSNYYRLGALTGASGVGYWYNGTTWNSASVLQAQVFFSLNADFGTNISVKAMQAWCNHGEDVATGTKTGSFGFQSNPAVAYTTFTYGADAGALASYPTTWTWTSTAIQEYPSIAKTSDLILAVRKTDTGTRVASVDFLGAYIEYTGLPAEINTPLQIAY